MFLKIGSPLQVDSACRLCVRSNHLMGELFLAVHLVGRQPKRHHRKKHAQHVLISYLLPHGQQHQMKRRLDILWTWSAQEKKKVFEISWRGCNGSAFVFSKERDWKLRLVFKVGRQNNFCLWVQIIYKVMPQKNFLIKGIPFLDLEDSAALTIIHAFA